MNDQIIVSDDWTKNWQASIAVKITALVLWVIIIIVFIASIYSLHDYEQQFQKDYNNKADRFAYQIASMLAENIDEARVKQDITLLSDELGFSAVTLKINKKIIRVGSIDNNHATIERVVPIIGSATIVNSSPKIFLYHKQSKAMAIEQRNHLVMAAFVVLVLFGAFLIWAIRTIVHRPLHHLVDATKAITEGNLNVRLDISREDEFGYLSRFFNQMLDRLMTQRTELQHALQEAKQQAELERALREAKSASKAKSAFLANMSHELRTPLNAIIGYSEMLKEDAEEQQQTQCVVDLDRINSAGRHLLSVINGILDLSKIEAGKMVVETGIFHIIPTLEEVINTIRPLVDRNKNQLIIEASNDLGEMNSDELKIRQILINLISNAAKFTEGGTVTISVEPVSRNNEQWIRIAVKDTGIGISADQIRRLFQDFSQADSSTTRKYGGTGLGLAISQRFCRLLGGDINVNSKPGKGSEFIVELPLDYTAINQNNILEKQLPDPKVVRQNSANKNNITNERREYISQILLIDSDRHFCESLHRDLANLGFYLDIAANGEKALQLISKTTPDVILLDLRLPDMDGSTLLDHIKTDPKFSSIPLILLGSYTDRIEIEKYEVCKIILKSDGKNSLIEAIKNCVRECNKSADCQIPTDKAIGQ